MIRVINLRERKEDCNTIRIDRGTPLGNPFKMKDESERDRVIAKYRVWLWQKIQDHDAQVLAELKKIIHIEKVKGVVYLGCWCSPKKCHGSVVRNCITWLKCNLPATVQ